MSDIPFETPLLDFRFVDHFLIHQGDFTLNSGAKSSWKLIADQFIEDNLAGLVELICILAGPFSRVEGIPRGGTRLAEALAPYCTIENTGHVILDDVLTTGGSMQRAMSAAMKVGRASRSLRGVVVFARGPLPPGVAAIFSMPEAFWLESRKP